VLGGPQAGDRLEHGRLAGARRPEERDDPGVDVFVDLERECALAEGEVEGDPSTGPRCALLRMSAHCPSLIDRRFESSRAPNATVADTASIAVAAASARATGLDRVAVLDYDVHHGNGTQEIVYEDPRIYHVDIHQDPWTIYPGTGFPEDIGRGLGRGTKYNIVMPPGCGDDLYLEAFSTLLAC